VSLRAANPFYLLVNSTFPFVQFKRPPASQTPSDSERNAVRLN